MTDQVELSIRQFVDAWRVFCNDAPGKAIEANGGVQYIFSGLPIGFFNVAVPTGRDLPADELHAQARQACAWASDKHVPWMFVVTHEALEAGVDAAASMEACGLLPVMPLTGMIAEQVAPVATVPAGLELTVPQHDAAYEALLEINAAAYGMDLAAGQPIMGRRSFWAGHFPVVGRAGDTPVSCAAVLMVEGYRYVAMVATDPGHQRRGYGDAAMRRALEESARVHGERPTVLHATDAGRPVYERMGYTTISTHTVFMEKTWLGGH
jgi:GNAT superfamily N-acetyltransferase